MKKISLEIIIEKVRLVALRFTFSLFYIVGLAVLFFLQINKKDIEIHSNMWVFFSLGIAISIVITLFSEGYKKKLVQLGLNVIGAFLLLLYCYTLPDKFIPVHYYQFFAFGISFILAIFYISFLKKDNDIPFWEFSKTIILQLFISFIFAQVLMLGLSLAVLSLQELFGVDIKTDVYANLSVICYALFAPVYFLANLTSENKMHKQEFEFNKFIKILGLYILLPILVLYLLILYVYLLQIIVKWELPNGWVSMLVSVLGLGGFLTMLILYPLRIEKENKVASLLSLYFPALLLPLLVLMSVGVFRRIDDYGLTINRLYVLILNVWLYGICIYLLLSKARQLKWIVISFSAILFISSVGPWSVFSVTKRTMFIEIGQLLNQSGLLKEGKAIDNTAKMIVVTPEISNALSSDIDYICDNYGAEVLQQYFKNSLKSESYSKIVSSLGIADNPIKDSYFSAFVDKKDNQPIDIESYGFFINLPSFNSEQTDIYKSNQVDITFKNLTLTVHSKLDMDTAFTIPLKPILKELIRSSKKRNSFSPNELTITTINYKLVLINVSGNYTSQNDSINLMNCNAQLFIK